MLNDAAGISQWQFHRRGFEGLFKGGIYVALSCLQLEFGFKLLRQKTSERLFEGLYL